MSTYTIPHTDPLAIEARNAFPDYNGRKYRVRVYADKGRSNWESYWSAGSRSYYVIQQLDGSMLAIPQNGTPFDPKFTPPFELPAPGFRVIEHTIFQGRDLGITVHVHSADASINVLAAPLTPVERAVLEITRNYISSYRLEEARQRGISRATWDATKQTLIERGFLAKNGAITIDGRNVIA